VPEVRDGVGPGPQPLLQAAGRRRGRRPAGGDLPGGPAVHLPGSRLRAEDLLRAGQRPDRTLRAEDAAAGRGAREHRGRAGRAGRVAAGARTGAPGAIQVADRFHLWQNLAKAVEKCVAAHRGCLAEPALAAAEDDAAPPAGAGRPDPAGKFADRARRKHELVHALRAEGRGLREIARHLGWGLHTVQRYDRAATWQELAVSRWPAQRRSKPGPFKPYPGQHAGGGHGSFTRLFHEIKALGYDGSYPVVRSYLDRTRPQKAPLGQAPPTVRDVTNWLCRRPDDLTGDERPRLKAILDRCPELHAASGQVRAFAAMITDLTGRHLPQWIAAARDAGLPGIASFAKGLEHDIDAVTNGLTMSWSSGPVEGRVNHIKMVKRQMFGRAGLPLLRKRVLLTAKN
jgi:hypothetical protein